MNNVYLEIGTHGRRCLECGNILEPHEQDFCHECNALFNMNGGVEMYDFKKELSYGN